MYSYGGRPPPIGPEAIRAVSDDGRYLTELGGDMDLVHSTFDRFTVTDLTTGEVVADRAVQLATTPACVDLLGSGGEWLLAILGIQEYGTGCQVPELHLLDVDGSERTRLPLGKEPLEHQGQVFSHGRVLPAFSFLYDDPDPGFDG